MRAILVDSNVILDVFLDDPKWGDWSETNLESCSQRALLCINPIVYSEISIGFERIEDLEFALKKANFKMLPISREASFLAGKAFLKYKQRHGKKSSPLPDFYIGAQAAVLGLELISRDVARYETYFPTVKLIHP